MVVKVSKPEINLREKISELDKPSGVAGQAMLAAETPQEQFNLISAGRRRMNINGAMNVYQRGNVTGLSTTGYGADRYLIQSNTAGTMSLTTDADVPEEGGFQSSYKIACTATATFGTDSNLVMIHRLEGQDSQCTNFGKPNASSLTLSFWIKSNRAGDFNVNFENELPTSGGADRGYQTKQTLNQADTWEYKVVTIEGDNVSGKSFTNNTLKGLCFEISLSKGGSAWAATASKPYWHDLANAERTYHNEHFFGDSTDNYWKITGVQLELGSVATPFEHRSYGEELALCHRYYYAFQTVSDTLGQNSFLSTAYSANTMYAVIDLPVQMRATPSIISGGTWHARKGDNVSFTLNAGIQRAGKNSMTIAQSSVSTANTGQAYWIESQGGTGYLSFQAEI